MCLMLYIGTADELPLASSPDLSIEEVDEPRQTITQWFSHSNVRFVGAHTRCSCGFPSVIAESPIDYFEGMWVDHDDREDDLRSVGALLDLLRQVVERSSSVELYPVWDGDQSEPPKGVIDWQVGALVPERFFFNERFMHVVRP
jgi:hypothetical protein